MQIISTQITGISKRMKATKTCWIYEYAGNGMLLFRLEPVK